MPHRIFTDVRGVGWDVWDVFPRSATGGAQRSGPTAITGPLARGWLAFQAGEARRRLAPIPALWEEASDEQLRRWCAEAMAVVPRQPRGASAALTVDAGSATRGETGSGAPAAPSPR